MKKILLLLLITLIIPTYPLFASTFEQYGSDKLDKERNVELSIPVIADIDIEDLDDTWGHARSAGTTHEGIDIVVPRWTLIVSPTEAYVTRIETTGGGGLVVWTLNPGGERFYFAHLQAVYPGLKVGDSLVKGSIIGFAGNSGNAQWTEPHLHFGVYSNDWVAENPYLRITKTLSEKENIKVLSNFLELLKKMISEKTRI